MLQDSFDILPPLPNGLVYRAGLYVPLSTINEHPEFASYHGYIGEENRKKVASSFLQPTTWEQFCTEVITEEECNSNNNTMVTRMPQTESEKGSYFSYPDYYGHFRETENTKCTTDTNNTKQCFGHFINFECYGRSYSEAQMFWNNIPLISTGPAAYNNGYPWQSAKEIGLAAYVTGDNVMMLIEDPNTYLTTFAKTERAWFRVELPQSSQECMQYHAENPLKCSDDFSERVGNSSKAACDYPIELAYKILSTVLKTSHDKKTDVANSPALDWLLSFEIGPNTIQEILLNLREIGFVTGELDLGLSEREVICQWVYDHLDYIESFVPKGYPRHFLDKSNPFQHTVLFPVSAIMSSVAICVIFITATMVYIMREKSSIRVAQVTFLTWMIGGR